MSSERNTVIRLEGVGKKYHIRHQKNPSYTALRDVVGDSLRSLGSRLLGRVRSARDTKEDFWALQDISFEIKQGDRLGIIGRNGAGKSTLLKLLSRITAPSQGRILLKGRVASLLEVGTGFHPELSGRENIFLNGAILGMHRVEITRKFAEIVAFAEIDKFIDTPVKRYSSGMYVRLAFAVAAHLDTDILLVDEVLAVGDGEFQKKCLGIMAKMPSAGRTLLFVSHNMAVIQRLCTQSIMLEKGRVAMYGNTQEIVDAYNKGAKSVDQTIIPNRICPEGGACFTRWFPSIDTGPNSFFYSEDPFHIHFELVLKRKIPYANFGFVLWTLQGELVWAMRSLDFGGEYIDMTPGKYSVTFSTDSLPVRPGDYQVQVSINDKYEGTIDDWYALPYVHFVPKLESGLPSRWQGILHKQGFCSITRQGEL